jgi:hypothetical protein
LCFADESFLTDDFLNRVIDWIPGMKGIRVRDLQRFVRWRDPNECLFNYMMESTEKACKASAIIVHSFDALDRARSSECSLLNVSSCLSYRPASIASQSSTLLS